MPPKKRAPKGMTKPLPPGQILTDLRKKEWRLGPLVGQGGFGYLYLGSDKSKSDVDGTASYVIKVEPHSNGPLFVELAFYQRAATESKISAWMKSHKQIQLGVPRFIGCGSFDTGGCKYRFMVMDRFGKDVEKLFLESGKKFPLHTVFGLGLRIVEVLEYLHEQEYVHADIKASNLLTGFGEKNSNLVYLVDYGLAYKYCPSGEHVLYKEDPKRKHDGTIEFTSRDAHKGLAPSRRGDLEILSYCMLQWLCTSLPWETNLTNNDFVMQEKIKFMKNIDSSLRSCFGSSYVPEQLAEFFKYVNELQYTEKPNYDRIKKWFRDALKKTGYPDDEKSVHFDVRLPEKEKAIDVGVRRTSRKRNAKNTKVNTQEGKINGDSTPPVKKARPHSSAKGSSTKRGAVKQASTVKKVKRLSNSHAKPKDVKSPKLAQPHPKSNIAQSGVSKRSKATKKQKLASAASNSAVLEGKRRVFRRNTNVDKVDFAQSP